MESLLLILYTQKKYIAVLILPLICFKTLSAQPVVPNKNDSVDWQPAPSHRTIHPGFVFSQANTSKLHSIRHTLGESGVTFGISETLEGYNNFFGGIESGRKIASTFDANISINLQKLVGLSGAMFYADLEDHAGGNPTDKLVGDAQTFDKNTSNPFFQVLAIWYQQKLFHDKLRIKLGKVDANSEFSVITNGLGFLNSSTQVSPTFFVFATFPDPHLSINLFYTPNNLVYTSFAVYRANQNDYFLNFYGRPELAQPTQHGLLYISETGLTWSHLPFLQYTGNFKLGLWGHTGTFTKSNGEEQAGTVGYYFIFDQTLWKPAVNENGSRGIKMFLEYGHANPELTGIYRHYGGGIVWKGSSENRPNDAFGVTAQNVQLSPTLHLPEDFDLEIETYYKFKISQWLNAKPDFQYVVHPSEQYPNAFVGTIALNFSFNS